MLVVTGGAQGTDALAALLASERHIPTRIVVGPSHRAVRRGITPITGEDMEEALPHVTQAARTLNKIVKNPITLELLMRNYHIVRDADCVYAFGKRGCGNQIDGGTGWSVALAQQLDKQVFLYDVISRRWYKWNRHDEPQPLSLNTRLALHPNTTAIVGTRALHLYPHAEAELRRLFA